MLTGAKVLMTGATGKVAYPIARELAKGNDVHALARFGTPASSERLEAIGVKCIKKSFAEDDLSDLPDDFTHVLHFAAFKESGSNDFDYAIAVNAVGTGKLMHHCRKASAFLLCSTTAVYADMGHRCAKETDPLLAEVMSERSPTYGISKIASEAVAKFSAEQWGIPTAIARLNVPYGESGGLPATHLALMKEGKEIPLHPSKPSYYNPVHEDDYVDQAVGLLGAASVPAVVVNWCGSERVSAEEWCEYLGSLIDVEPQFSYLDSAIRTACCDTSLMHRMIGKTKIPWRDGMRRMVETTVGRRPAN